MADSAYQPYVPARRPGGKPSKKQKYRVLVHRRYLEMWQKLPERVGIVNAQQFYDHVAHNPGMIPSVGQATILAGKAGRPAEEGFSRTIHYEITGAGRIDYQFNDSYCGGARGDPHPVVRIRTIDLSSH
ncbi:MAG: hypothetical protein HY675_14250 [Chloroflexi bacterium]|nr:hypothetical protein [Chloroflexota bacterium]